MSGIGQDPTWGDKGSNYHFQLSLLRILDRTGTSVKSFSNGSLAGLEADINTWLAANPKLNVVDISLSGTTALVQYKNPMQ